MSSFEDLYKEETGEDTQKSEEVAETPDATGQQDKPADPVNALNQMENKDEQEFSNFKYTPKQNNRGGRTRKFDPRKDDIEPVSVDVTKLKTFSRSYAATSIERVPSAIIPLIDHACQELNKRGFTLRSARSLDRNHLETLMTERAERVEYYNIWKTAFDFPEELMEKLKVPEPTKKAYEIACGLDLQNTLRWQEFKVKKTPGFTAQSIGDIVRDWNSRKDIRKKFSARTVHIYLGDDCETALNVLFIYSECGSESTSKTDFKKIGNLKYEIERAEMFNIPVLNFGNPNFLGSFNKLMEKFN